ncbi:hypothetical protein KOW79_018688 [Hemibagrus wyckioides]|uniref:Uncharacterized protein n=1 Tax=Hemibagrus wyckioides TaxID=337641 RepID=A0A9D3NA76_9TELE|nr:hypothetical protein KOW79_018688 [Hemibagrus wyckioides]
MDAGRGKLSQQAKQSCRIAKRGSYEKTDDHTPGPPASLGSDYNKSAQPDTSTFTIHDMQRSCHAALGSQALQIPREKVVHLHRRLHLLQILRYGKKHSLNIRELQTGRKELTEPETEKTSGEKLPLVPNEYLSRSGMIAFTLLPSLSTSLLSQPGALSGNASRQKDAGVKHELQLLLLSFQCSNISTQRTSENHRCHTA